MAGENKSCFGDAGFREVLNMSVPAGNKAILVVTDAVAAKLKTLNLSEEKQLEIGLALQEALANAVVHGCQNDSSKTVRCRMMSDDGGRVLITVSDPGPGFDPESPTDPRLAENLYADHGRGIYLIRQLMDKVQFDSGGQEIRMWKY
jgi:serine/threonine-protein kinase RsbW